MITADVDDLRLRAHARQARLGFAGWQRCEQESKLRKLRRVPLVDHELAKLADAGEALTQFLSRRGFTRDVHDFERRMRRAQAQRLAAAVPADSDNADA